MSSLARKSFVAALALVLGTTAVSAADVTIRYSRWLPPGYPPYDQVIEPWFAEIERVTEGRVVVEVLPKTVGSVVGQYDVVAEGLADMAYISLVYTPGRFVPMEFAELAGAPGKPEHMSKAYYRTYENHIKGKMDIFPGVVALTAHVATPLQPATKGVKIEKPEDMRGLKMRTTASTLTAAYEILGVVPIHKSSAEVREMLASGTIDGQTTIINTVKNFNGVDVHDHLFVLTGGLANAGQIIGINEDKWAEISPADQEAILAISGEKLADAFSRTHAEDDLKAIEIFKQNGYTITYSTPEVDAQFRELLAPITQDWFERAKAAGLENPEEVLQEYYDELRRIEEES